MRGKKYITFICLLLSALLFAGCIHGDDDAETEKEFAAIVIGSDNYEPYLYTEWVMSPNLS